MLNSKQFLITARDDRSPLHWERVEHSAFRIVREPQLRIWQGKCADAVPATLLGVAVETTAYRLPPEEALERCSSGDIPHIYGSWTGRWVLLLGDELHLDAGGTLGVFYIPESGFVSSSVALLAEAVGAEPGPAETRHEVGIDWYAGPATRVPGIVRLMPSQILNLGTHSVRPRRLLEEVPRGDPAEQFALGLMTAIVNLRAKFGRFYLPLTAGRDSRTILSATIAAGVAPATYTFDKPKKITRSDRELPPVLARTANLTHTFIQRRDFSRDRQALFDRHCCGQCVGVDRDYVGYCQWEDWALEGAILRGGCFEFGRGHWYHRVPPEFDPTNASAGEKLHDLMARGADRRKQVQIADGLSRWIAWIVAHPEPELDFRDRLYLEQRIGSWLADIEQALDFTGTERVHIANCRRFYSIMNSVPQSERHDGNLQKHVIQRLAPHLATFPFNARDPGLFRAIRRKLIGAVRKASLFMSRK